MFDIKSKTLEVTAFLLETAKKEYLIARGWKINNSNLFEPKDINDFYFGMFDLSEDGYGIDYAILIESYRLNK